MNFLRQGKFEVLHRKELIQPLKPERSGPSSHGRLILAEVFLDGHWYTLDPRHNHRPNSSPMGPRPAFIFKGSRAASEQD
jgi:hypothetical protein